MNEYIDYIENNYIKQNQKLTFYMVMICKTLKQFQSFEDEKLSNLLTIVSDNSDERVIIFCEFRNINIAISICSPRDCASTWIKVDSTIKTTCNKNIILIPYRNTVF